MQSGWHKLRRRSLPPSVDVFDDKMLALETSLSTKVEAIRAELSAVAAQCAELRPMLQTIRIRQDDIHAADQNARARREALDALAGPKTTQEQVLELLRLVAPKRVVDLPKIRTGSEYDGGYVMIDDFDGVTRAFSLGVSTNDDWDVEFAKRGIDVDQYDYSIESPPTSHERLHFYPFMVTTTGEENTINLQQMVEAYDEKSKCILKADIEGSEWDVIDQASSGVMKCFSQIVCEFHWLQQLTETDFFSRALRVFKKIDTTHQSVHVHANNCAPLVNIENVAVPVVLEVTYARRGTYEFAATDEIFPSDLDAPNDKTKPDIFLGSMQF